MERDAARAGSNNISEERDPVRQALNRIGARRTSLNRNRKVPARSTRRKSEWCQGRRAGGAGGSQNADAVITGVGDVRVAGGIHSDSPGIAQLGAGGRTA